MSMLETAALRLNLWQRELYHAATVLGNQLKDTDELGFTPNILWWGAAYSDLLSLCAGSIRGKLIIADSDPRRLRTSTALVDNASGIRLVALADLSRDAKAIELLLQGAVMRDIDAYLALEEKLRSSAERSPAVADGWADHLFMDFTLNRVDVDHESKLMSEAFRTLSATGSIICTLLVGDEPVSARHSVKSAPVGAALQIPSESAVIAAFQQAGFHGITFHWSTAANIIDRIGDVDVRMCSIKAYKGKQGPCWELGQAVMCRGPWLEVQDDDGHVYRRGERVAVCAKTFGLMMRAPYQGAFLGLRSVNEPPLARAVTFGCNTSTLRDPKVTKGLAPFDGGQAEASCSAENGCC
ncbi:hypothetical protein ATG98_1407 [Marinobacter sp. LV10R520-4]|uniref:hypothetical protein n=1 Tax=Marinobacter sp. LV10R520-4 TaxID=1761796 RepID=UPI000BF42964|nr:hypothetical protein [Marinobacter sp. LV10R520-4]PFG52387.1 hypothetical protein ATG98_1407 [Marinobacter sp. LV10R520-4]